MVKVIINKDVNSCKSYLIKSDQTTTAMRIMALPCFSLTRLILLLTLLMSATPLRPSPIDGEADSVQATWDWPMERSENSYSNFMHNGRPLPNFKTGETTPEFFDAIAKGFNFPLLPLSLNGRLRRLWHQRYAKYLKELQLHQTSWMDNVQSPGDESMPKLKRNSILWPPNEDNEQTASDQPDYPYAYVTLEEQHKLKDEPSDYKGPLFRPSISAGAMTNLGDFFKQLRANVQFAEHSHQLDEGDSQLLEGVHRHQLEKEESDTKENEVSDSGQSSDRKKSKLLQSLLSYRPSQKIRSLVSRNPNGYRGSQFIDPSYMWLGLGK
ncbi:uncharacterized protein LOC6560459 isoform X2 [Drosophila grimshawi]|uniref:uncharacterized protein LOC6560459 isoform X2 n=1 Tax=Drosophila grimshawi TaxID=7222 RepID=UPI000C86FD76|nr:uncharacterized protein LOC6560459 isoform X2 [Drosophila grimshawi]